MTVCASCRRALLSSLRRSTPSTTVLRTSIRTVATVPSTKNAASSNPPPPTAQSSTPNAISSSNPAASQPFSTPELAPQNTHKPAAADLARPPTTAKLQGSLPGGTELRGLNYIKGSPPIMTMEDNEYPDWLWTILTPKSSATDGQLAKGELAEMTKKQRTKYFKQQEKLRKSMPKQIPLHEQSIDLTGEGATAQESLAKRQELTKSQRDARRKGIREANFLKTM